MKSNIRKLRNEKQISQSTLAKVLGKTQQCVSHMENDRNSIPVESLLTMADYFGVTTDYILGRMDEEPKKSSYEEGDFIKQETEGLRSIIKKGDSELIYELVLSLLLCSLEGHKESVP